MDTQHTSDGAAPTRAGAVGAPWTAPYASAPVTASVRLPGSKSLTNRYLVLAALADEDSRVRLPLRSRDTLLMADALRGLGVGVDDVPARGTARDDGDDWVIRPTLTCGGEPVTLECGLAGTVLRFLPPVAALTGRRVRFDGDEQARGRPMGPGLAALRDLGVRVTGDALPFEIEGPPGAAAEVRLDASASSQFVSGLLLAAPRFPHGLTVRHVGPPVPSMPHIRMTVEALRDTGVDVDDATPDVWHVEQGEVRGLDVMVEPDLSNAAAFLAAAMVTGGRIEVRGWPAHTTQAGDAVREIFAAMGGDLERDRAGLRLQGPDRPHGVDLDLHDVGELTPVVAAVAALADGPSTLRGIAHLRGHETDRLAALAAELTALGAEVAELPDGLRIIPRPLHGALLRTYADHRMAMAGAVLGLAVPGVTLDDVATTSKTMPDFAQRWHAMLTDGEG